MHEKPKSIAAFQQAIADHKFRSEFVDHLNRVVPLLNEHDTLKKIGGMTAFLKTHVVDHFALEEAVVFPELVVAYADSASRQLIAELHEEHELLLVEVGKLTDLLSQAKLPSAAEALAQLEPALRGFLAKLQRHAAKEDQLLVPLVAGYARQLSE